MLSWQDVMMKQEQYKDLLRESENRALIQQANMEPRGRARVGLGVLAVPVRLLINLVSYLLGSSTFVFKVPVQMRSRDVNANENW